MGEARKGPYYDVNSAIEYDNNSARNITCRDKAGRWAMALRYCVPISGRRSRTSYQVARIEGNRVVRQRKTLPFPIVKLGAKR